MRLSSLAFSTLALALAIGAQQTTMAGQEGEVVRPKQVPNNPPPPDNVEGYRPPWANPNAKPPEPGIENDPTPFNPADVEVDSDQLNNNIDPLNQD
jgi:hypothetical protein